MEWGSRPAQTMLAVTGAVSAASRKAEAPRPSRNPKTQRTAFTKSQRQLSQQGARLPPPGLRNQGPAKPAVRSSVANTSCIPAHYSAATNLVRTAQTESARERSGRQVSSAPTAACSSFPRVPQVFAAPGPSLNRGHQSLLPPAALGWRLRKAPPGPRPPATSLRFVSQDLGGRKETCVARVQEK